MSDPADCVGLQLYHNLAAPLNNMMKRMGVHANKGAVACQKYPQFLCIYYLLLSSGSLTVYCISVVYVTQIWNGSIVTRGIMMNTKYSFESALPEKLITLYRVLAGRF